uniref:uncharacterized protein LOC109973102 n=1 Tax=Monopterus albus TaxID=43700 RepID=UPI0009B3F5DD|nr:uncharacterized protein LOC109973102 [Monopterus albus]
MTDAALAEKNNDAYKWLSHAAFGKCQAMCNKSAIRPNQTRWNSTYTAVERILRIIRENGEDAIRNVCEQFKVKMLSPAEIVFLTEYCTVMKPVVKALNILQSETITRMGWLLPVIFQLQAKLSRLETSSKMCLPLIRAVQDGGQKRFDEMMYDRELIAAAIFLPKFKNISTERAEIIEAGLVYVKQNLDQMAEAAVEQVVSLSSDEEDFFSSMKSRRSQGTGELDGYLACVSHNMDLLNSFPHTG